MNTADRVLSSLPRKLTLFRLAAVPVLWLVAAAAEPLWLGVGVAIAAATDVIDGPLARHYRRTTPEGSRLDSIADHALSASVLIWIVWLRPEFAVAEWPLLALWLCLGTGALLAGWAKFGRLGDLHLYSAKVAGALAYLFGIWLLIAGTYHPAAFLVVIAMCMLAAVENLLVILTRSDIDEHIGSIFRRPGPS